MTTTPISGPPATTVSYAYDGVGNRTQLTDPEGDFLTYEYDALNRLDRGIPVPLYYFQKRIVAPEISETTQSLLTGMVCDEVFS